MGAQPAPQIINTLNPKVCHRSPSLKFLRSNHLFRGVISHFCITPRIFTMPGTLVRTLQATSQSCSWYKKLRLMPATTLERSCVCGHPPPPGQKKKKTLLRKLNNMSKMTIVQLGVLVFVICLSTEVRRCFVCLFFVVVLAVKLMGLDFFIRSLRAADGGMNCPLMGFI